jgi:hypothetical protein
MHWIQKDRMRAELRAQLIPCLGDARELLRFQRLTKEIELPHPIFLALVLHQSK